MNHSAASVRRRLTNTESQRTTQKRGVLAEKVGVFEISDDTDERYSANGFCTLPNCFHYLPVAYRQIVWAEKLKVCTARRTPFLHPALAAINRGFLAPRQLFKSAVSTNFTIGAERLCRHLVPAEFNSQTVANGLSSGGEVRQCSKRYMNA